MSNYPTKSLETVRLLATNKAELTLAVYGALGIGLFLLIHSIAGHYLNVLGIMHYAFDTRQAILLSLLWGVVASVAMFLIMILFKRHFTEYAFVLPMVSFSPLGLAALATASGAFNVWNIIYLFVTDSILGISYQIYIAEHTHRFPLEYDSATKGSKLQTLEMEHREVLQHVNLLLWGTTIAITGIVVAGFIPLLNAYKNSIEQEALRGLLLTSVVLVIYFVAGVWFGVLAQMLKRLETLRKKVLEVKHTRLHVNQ
jgi:hypothetical protein